MSDPQISFDPKRKQLSIVYQDLEKIPPSIASKYATTTLRLDLSHNSFSSLDSLTKFTNLTHLVLDNNSISGDTTFPSFPKLRVLSINNNNIENLDSFVEKIKSFPLQYLSLLRNIACPNALTGKEEDDYQRYRYRVLYLLPSLKFLDTSKVTPKEVVEAKRVGKYIITVRPTLSPDESETTESSPITSTADEAEYSQSFGQETYSRSRFGVTRYIYTGRASEGNRFISNDDL